jgi:glycerol uptake facilitator-like aquaporin
MANLSRRLAAEAVGSLALAATVVGSGIMAERLTGDGAVALLCNALATGAMLVVLIAVLGPISGAHLNPVVSMVLAIRRELSARVALAYGAVQVAGMVLGVLLAHAMFDLPLLQVSTHTRSGAGQWVSEAVATCGLLLVILGGRARTESVPALVGLYIMAAYWFTASTSFANPAITVARALSNTFAGIRPEDAPAFTLAQIIGGVVAMALTRALSKNASTPTA